MVNHVIWSALSVERAAPDDTPYLQRHLKCESGLGVIEVHAQDLACPVEAVQQGISMQVQALGSPHVVAVALEESLQGVDQLGPLPLVVCLEPSQQVVVEGSKLWIVA